MLGVVDVEAAAVIARDIVLFVLVMAGAGGLYPVSGISIGGLSTQFLATSQMAIT